MPRKCVFLLLDGIGGRSYKSLSNKTPLQSANTPGLDSISARGANGLYHPSLMGQALSSELAHLIMFGYPPEHSPGRAPLEALGAGINLKKEQVAVLARLVNVHKEDDQLILAADRVQMEPEDVASLFKDISSYSTGDLEFKLYPTEDLFGLVLLTGNGSTKITDCDPHRSGSYLSAVKPWAEARDQEESRNTASAMTEYIGWCHKQLLRHQVNLDRVKNKQSPLNALVTQRAGRLKDVPSFQSRFGMRGLTLSSSSIVKGLAAYLEMDHEEIKTSGDAGLDIYTSLQRARKHLDEYDFIHIHAKSADQAAHEKNPLLKKEVIEAVDKGIQEAIDFFVNDSGALLIIAGDHSTPSSGPLLHSGEPVPVCFAGRGVRRDKVASFDEVASATGSLGILRGQELMLMMLSAMDKARLMGLRETPEELLFWPGIYEPFRLS